MFDMFSKDKEERSDSPRFVLLKKAELHFPSLLFPSSLPGYETEKRYAALFAFVPHTDFSQVEEAQRILGRPHDTVRLIKEKTWETSCKEPITRISVSAKSFDRPLMDPDAEHLVAGDLVDAVLQVFRVVNPRYCGVGASLVYIRKVRQEEINELV